MKIIKPEQSPSSQSLESPGDTNSVPLELTDIDFPNLGTNFIGSHKNINNNAVSPHQASSSIDNNNSLLSNLNDNNLTWAAAGELAATVPLPHPQLPWPSSLLSPTNAAVNSLILKALQLKSVAAMSSSCYGHNPPAHSILQLQPALPADSQFGMGTDLGSSFNVLSSSSKQQLGVEQQQQQEQSFDWASFNEGI